MLREPIEVMNYIDDSALDLAAIVGEHVASGKFAILLAARDEPIMPQDSGWQFRSNAEGERGKVWKLREVLELEPSLRPFLSSPIGTILRRETENDKWKVSREEE